MQIAVGVVMKDVATGYDDFLQQVAIIVKLKELPKVLRDKIIKQQLKGESYRAIANSVSTIGSMQDFSQTRQGLGQVLDYTTVLNGGLDDSQS